VMQRGQNFEDVRLAKLSKVASTRYLLACLSSLVPAWLDDLLSKPHQVPSKNEVT